MSKVENETRTILRKLGVFVLFFYVVIYVASIAAVGASHAGWSELGRFPFRIAHDEFNPGLGGPALGAWVVMVVTEALCVLPSFYVVRVTRKTWDYMTTTAVLHWVLCCLVNLAFPTNWIWWVTLIVGTALLILAAELAIYWLRDMREIPLDN